MKYNINYNLKGGATTVKKIKNNLMTDLDTIEKIIEDINKEKYDDDYTIDIDWKINKLEQIMTFDKLKDDDLTNSFEIGFNLISLRNPDIEENSKPLFILPGFSGQSVGWTISRISKYHQIIFEKKFSDIHIFDFTAIGGEKTNKETVIQSAIMNQFGSNAINDMYIKIAKFIKEQILSNYENISLIGRSAGGGLALHIVLTHGQEVNSLNLACPGTNNEAIESKISEYDNKNLPIRMCFAYNDQKIPIVKDDKENPDGIRVLNDLFFKNGFLDYMYYEVSTPNQDDKYNHRIQPILIENII